MVKQICFDYEHYAALSELPEPDRRLVAEAEQASASAHAAYSHFRVGAAARLRSGRILRGSNFESEVFPAGLCAERSLLFYAQANHRFGPLRAGVLSLRTVPSGAGRCRTAAGNAPAGDHVRRRNGLGGLLRDAAAALYLQVVTLRRCSHPTTFSTRTITC